MLHLVYAKLSTMLAFLKTLDKTANTGIVQKIKTRLETGISLSHMRLSSQDCFIMASCYLAKQEGCK